MPFQLIPNIIFLAAIAGIIILVLRHLPEATAAVTRSEEDSAASVEKLQEKGLPAQAISKSRVAVIASIKRAWHFMLEAKGLRHSPGVNYKIKQLLHKSAAMRAVAEAEPIAPDSNHDENYFIEQIKRSPKDRELYNKLGQYYVNHNNFTEASSVYEYLTQHDPRSHDFWARLAYCQYRLNDFNAAAESYRKSIALDSSHPNRYYNLALVEQRLEEPGQAVASLQQALQMDPENKKYQQALAEIRR